MFVILFVAALQLLPLFGFDLDPLLASAGVAGIAIGFGLQALVEYFINGFTFCSHNQHDIGGKVSIAGVTNRPSTTGHHGQHRHRVDQQISNVSLAVQDMDDCCYTKCSE